MVYDVPGILVSSAVALSVPWGELLPLPTTLPHLQDNVDGDEVH